MNANKKIPEIVYGTAWKKENTTPLVVKAISEGFRAIDTACQPKHYNEPGVGEALSILGSQGIKREDIFLQTKFTPIDGQDPNRAPYDPSLPLNKQVAQSFEVSKRNLRTNYVDSLLLHSPLFPYSNLLQVWETMQNIYQEGGAKSIGISNCYDLNLLKKLYDDATVKPSIVQNRFYEATDYDKDLRSWCNDNGVIYQSFWSLTANPDILLSPTLMNLAAKYKKTPEQLFFRFLMDSNIVPLTGTTSEIHMKEDLEVQDIHLSDEDYRLISALV